MKYGIYFRLPNFLYVVFAVMFFGAGMVSCVKEALSQPVAPVTAECEAPSLLALLITINAGPTLAELDDVNRIARTVVHKRDEVAYAEWERKRAQRAAEDAAWKKKILGR